MLCDKQCDKHRSQAIISLMTGSETEAAKGIEASALTLLFRAAFAFGDTSALLAFPTPKPEIQNLRLLLNAKIIQNEITRGNPQNDTLLPSKMVESESGPKS